MSLIDIPRCPSDDTFAKGTWTRMLFHTAEPEFKAYWSAIICCPECGKYLNLVNHKIAADGQISPSVGHPNSYPPCGWHVTPKLLDWLPEEWGLLPQNEVEICAGCGRQSHSIGGWGTWNKSRGIACPACLKQHADSMKDKP